jgi:hypothetical protein
MPIATLGAVRVTAVVPRTDPMGGPAAQRLERACGEPFAGALREAFARLDDLDPGAFWIIRELRLQVNVAASEPDPAVQARRITAAIAAAVERVVRDGPGGDAVRFTSRGSYAASFVQALLAGAAGSWVYDRVDAIRRLPPAPALLAVPSYLDVPLLDLVAQLAGTPAWAALITASTGDELQRLDHAIRSAAGPDVPVPAALLESARATRATMTPRWQTSVTARRLRLLAHLGVAFGVSSIVVAAVWRVEPDSDAPAGEWTRRERRPEAPPGLAARSSADDVLPASASPATSDPIAAGFALAGPGAVVFMLVPDLDELLPAGHPLAARTGAAVRVRAQVLRAVVGPGVPDDDPLLAMAAGATAADGTNDEQVSALLTELSPWAVELVADPVLGHRHEADQDWFAAPPSVSIVANALWRTLARHLLGFSGSAASYLVERVLPPGGVVIADTSSISVDLPSPQLQVVLQLAGLDVFAARPRWLDQTLTVTHQDYR